MAANPPDAVVEFLPPPAGEMLGHPRALWIQGGVYLFGGGEAAE